VPSPLGRSVHDGGVHRPPSTTHGQRPGSRLNLRPKATTAQTSMGIAQSSRKGLSTDPTTPAGDSKRGLPSSSYMTPSSTPGSGRSIRHLSHSSVASNASSSNLTERQISISTPQDTPTSAGAAHVMDESPSSRTAARPTLGSRPGTAMAMGGNRRISMLPQPKRAASGVATAAAASAMASASGRVSNSAVGLNGRTSQMGRGTSMGIQSSTDERRQWKY